MSRWRAVLRTPVGVAATLLLVLLLSLAALAPLLWSGRASAIDVSNISAGPSARHWLGTDLLGRDTLFRVLVATRLSVGLALAATAIAVLAGLLLGTTPSVLGLRAGRIVTAVVNIAVAFPPLLLALFFAVIFGVGALGAMLAIGFALAPGFARLTQTLAAGVSGRDYVAAARIAGVSRFRLVTRHILPNIGEPLAVNAAIGAGGALLAFAGLSFLGLGVQPPSYDWGQLLHDGLSAIYEHPAAALGPSVAVVIAGLAFSLFGEMLAKRVGLRVRSGRSLPSSAPPDVPPDVLPAALPSSGGAVLEVRDLRVSFTAAGGATVTPVRGVSLTVRRGEAVGLVGESGSGKSLTALAIAALIEDGTVDAGRLDFLGHSLLDGAAAGPAGRRMLGASLSVVFQDPMSALNPSQRVGAQLAEVATQHAGLSRRAALARAADRLRAVRIPAAERRLRQYPHEFSGGMRQRAMIAMGMMGTPALIVADEPTTALDVTVQRQVLRLLGQIRAEQHLALLLISHDIAVVGQACDRIMVMYAGRIVEELPARGLRTRARHPYTRALLAALPDLATDRELPLAVIGGLPPAPAEVGAGCAFAPRCPLADDRCRSEEPVLAGGVACWNAKDADDG